MNGPRPQQSPLDLLALTRRELDIFDAGYLSGCTAGLQMGLDHGGYSAGVAEGWRLRIAHQEAAWQVMARNVRTMSGLLPFVERQARLIAPPANYRPMPTYAECLSSWDDDTGQATR